MVVDPFTALGTASAVLELGRTAWKLGSALVKLYRDTKCIDATIDKLAREVKALSNECDLVHAEMEDVIKASETQGASPYDIDGRLWECLATQVQECNETIQALKHVVNDVAQKASDVIGQAQRQMRLNKNRENLEGIRLRIRTHTDSMRTTLLVINIKVAHIAPGYANRELSQKLDNLQDMVDNLQKSMDGGTLRASGSDANATLVQCAREVITKGTTMYEASVAAPSILGGQGAANSNIRVAQWVNTLDLLRREEPLAAPSEVGSALPSVFSGDDVHTSLTGATSVQHEVAAPDLKDGLEDDDSDHELAIDLATAALEAGTQAFEGEAWSEADALLQETLLLLQGLPKGRRGFCDIFNVQYKLAVCAYHTQAPRDAEGALKSLLQQSAKSDQQRRHICDVAHLLALLYTRMNQLSSAKSACEKALQARRRLFGKQDDTSLASMALMSRIYEHLQNKTLAKVYLTMLPEDRKTEILQALDRSLVDSCVPSREMSRDCPSPATGSDIAGMLEKIDLTRPTSLATSSERPETMSRSTIALSATASDDLLLSKSPSSADMPDHRRDSVSSNTTPSENTASGMVPRHVMSESSITSRIAVDDALGVPEQRPRGLPRTQVLRTLGFKPKTPLDKAICSGKMGEDFPQLVKDHPTRTSGLRRQFTIRATPLHFATLFGEVEMARQILATNVKLTDVEIPAKLFWTMGTPFHWAVLGRQTEILRLFLTTNPGVLNTLVQAPGMPRSMYMFWLACTISDAERADGIIVPKSFIEMVEVLLEHGWPINNGIGQAHWTFLHYATFLGLEYDPHGLITSYLCKHGANPMIQDADGCSPYRIAARESKSVLVQLFDQIIEERAAATVSSPSGRKSTQ